MNRSNTLLLGVAIILSLLIVIGFDRNNSPAENNPDWEGDTWEESEKPKPGPQPGDDDFKYENALSLAKEKKKDLFLYFESKDCDYCEQMKDTTLDDKRVKKALEKYYVYFVDVDKETQVAIQYEVSKIPTYCVVDAEKSTPESPVILKKGVATKNPTAFLLWLRNPTR
jgi:thioredoxin-related protein